MISEHIIDPILCVCVLAFLLACALYGCDVLKGIIDSRRAYKNHLIAEKQRKEDEQRFKEVEEFTGKAKLNDRDLRLRHIPSYILDEARENIELTIKDKGL